MIANFVINMALAFLYAVGIYNIWHNYLYAGVGVLVFSALSQNPILALIAYPAFEYFVVGHLTVYGIMVIFFTVIQLIYILVLTVFSRR